MALDNLSLSDTNLAWIVNKPVFVAWNDDFEGPKRLGLLSPLNATSSFTIHIGWNPTDRHALVILKLPISVRSARKARDMFMIVSPESTTQASIRSGPASELTTAHETDIRACLGSAHGADPMLFCVSFQTNGSSDVIMPKAKREKVVQGQPKELMLDLRSLSEAQSFDVYFRFDSYAQRSLHSIFADLSTFKIPFFELERMYSGRGGGVNLWYDQGLRSCDFEGNEQGKAVDERDDIRATIEYTSVEKSEEQLRDSYIPPPPPYSREDTVPSAGFSRSASQDGPLVLVTCSDVDGANTPSTRSVASLRDPVPETPLQKVSFEAQAWIEAILDYRSPSFGLLPQQPSPSRKRRAESLPPCDWPPRPIASARTAEVHARLPSDDRRADSLPPPCELSQHQVASAEVTETTPPLTFRDPRLHTDELSRNIGESSRSDDKAHGDGISLTLAEEITQWLYNAWMVYPNAHHDLRTHLISWRAAIDEAASQEARAECSMRLSFAMVCTDHSQLPDKMNLNTIAQAEDQVREVVKWLNQAGPGMDLRLIHYLTDLARKAMIVVTTEHGDEQRIDSTKEFWLAKARCIVEACDKKD